MELNGSYIKRGNVSIMNNQQLIAPESSFNFMVNNELSGNRIDKYITAQFPLYSRTFFNRLIEEGHIRLNGAIVTKSSTPVSNGDMVLVQFPAARAIPAMALQDTNPDVEILFTHPHFLIIYKPHGLLMHPPSMANQAPTLVDWLLVRFNDIKQVGYVDRPGIVHRLDKETSGVLIIPRTNHAHSVFGDMFRERTIEKTYHAVVQGHPARAGTIDAAIGRCPITKTKMTTRFNPNSSAKMRHATTHYRVIEYFDDAALVEVKPITGRTHQIRVHFASIGHPIIGDQVYGKKSKLIERQALHAYRLAFQFEGKPYEFTKEVPADFEKMLLALRGR